MMTTTTELSKFFADSTILIRKLICKLTRKLTRDVNMVDDAAKKNEV